MSTWKTVARKKKLAGRFTRSTSTAASSGASAGLSQELAKEILASLFSAAPNLRAGSGGPSARPRPEYLCTACGCSNWADRTFCRQCGEPRPAGRPAVKAPAGRAMGPRAKALARPGSAAASPGQQAEALRQAAAIAKRAGAAPEALQPLAEAERAARQRHAAAKVSTQIDAARAAVDHAAAAVASADAAIISAETSLALARQKAEAARGRHRDKVAELDRVISASTNPSPIPVVFQQSVADLLSKAQRVTASLDRLQSAAANGSMPDAFRQEVFDLKAAMSSAQQASLAASPAARAVVPLDQGAGVDALMAGAKQLLMILETGKVGLGRDLPDELLESMTTLHQTVQAIKPVGLPDLNEALEPVEQTIACSEFDEDGMRDEGELDAKAHQILAQIQSGPPEAALGFVRDHIAAVAGKGGGKGVVRFAPH